ncbi:MAG: TetR/AcrR family transcriptional regulator [Nocardioidaceae bacterium]|nr:TetR/AcrR family transcriptional regulator [Nocardioidaceae bacterium]
MATTRKGQRTEAAFLQAARQTFAERGYFNTKISDIATAAGRSTGSFYNYYDNKEQLLVALLEAFTMEIVEASALPKSRNPADGVRAAVTAYWNTYKKYLPEMIGLFEMSMMDSEFQQRWRENRTKGIQQILVGLEAANRTGLRIDLPLDLLASALVCTLESFCWTWLATGGDIGVEAPDDETAIETLSAIWYRTVYGAPTEG